MRAADAATVAAGTPVTVLMERAGHAVAADTCRLLATTRGSVAGARVHVLCGPGANGGDGYVAARLLASRGVGVRVFALADPSDPAAAAARERLRAAGHQARELSAEYTPGEADVVIDALFGTGLGRPLAGVAEIVVNAVNSSGVPVLAVDIPSGCEGETGVATGAAVRAVCTVAMQTLKTGLLVGDAAHLAGTIRVADLGIRLGGVDPECALFTDPDVSVGARPVGAHKWNAGAVLVIGGSAELAGAPALAARAAFRAGASLVVVAAPEAVAPLVRTTTPEAMALPLAGPVLAPPHVPEILGRAGRFGAVVLGPGLGQAGETAAAVRALLEGLQVPVVLDADGINALARPQVRTALTARTAATILTPHDAEFERAGGKLEPARWRAAHALAEELGATVLLKGGPTFVAAPRETPIAVGHDRPRLATAGSGDVLSGAIAALVAAGTRPVPAAATAAHVHGAAADALPAGPILAGELADALAATLAQFGWR